MIYESLPYVGGGSHAVYDCMKCQKDGHGLRWHAFGTFFVLWHGHTLYGMEPLGTIPFFVPNCDFPACPAASGRKRLDK